MKIACRRLLVAALLIAAVLAAPALFAAERSEIPDQYKWDVTALFATMDAAKAAKAALLTDLPKVAAFKGKLGVSAAEFKAAYGAYYGVELRLRRLEAYASRLADQDARVSENKAFQSEVRTARTQFTEASSFFAPETIGVGAAKLDGYFQADPGLKIYQFPVRETLRLGKHILSDKEERIMAAAGELTAAGDSIYNLFTNAELPRQTVALSDGRAVKLSYAEYAKARESLVEQDRITAFTVFFRQYHDFRRTLAETLHTQLKAHQFNANCRGYDSTLAAALDASGVDEKIYHSLIAAAHRNLPTFHRYLKLKARALGKERLDYTDVYAPFTKAIELKVTYPAAQTLLLNALATLGKDYVDVLREAFAGRWIDVYPNEGKDSGAYSDGWGYGVHPYVLMNYTDTYGEALTLAHELGHAMHSYNSNQAQPFPTADYSTFVAEVASTFNENLLNDAMLKKVKSDDERLYLLGHFLDESIKGTFFRQTQFAEFELLIHQMVERGEALSDENLSQLFLKLVREYYGADQGVVNVPDFIADEWSIIPHFYYNYYVFQYATSFAASNLLSEQVIAKAPGALERYRALLRAGGSDNPVKLLQTAGADMTNPQAYDALMKRANRYMDEMEKLLAKKGKK
jgi:oligoendopeptidase F